MSIPRITVAHGDGIGPEIMAATLNVLEAAGANFAIDTIEIGERVYNRGLNAGIEDSSWNKLIENKFFLKAPITTPQVVALKVLMSLFVSLSDSMRMSGPVAPMHLL